MVEADDITALNDLYLSLKGDSWNITSDWTTFIEEELLTGHGIEISNNRVIRLVFPDNNMQGDVNDIYLFISIYI